MTARLHSIPAHEYRRERWRNGLGWTREILRMPSEGDWDWRLSIAEIEQDAAFSAFPGIERELVLLDGPGVRLRFADGTVRSVEQPFGRVRFPGEAEIFGELIDGPTRDFNLMWRRDRVDAELWHRPLVGSMVLFAEPDEQWIVHVLAGRAQCSEGEAVQGLDAGDTAWIRTGPTRGRCTLDGGGEVLLIRLRPVATAG